MKGFMSDKNLKVWNKFWINRNENGLSFILYNISMYIKKCT